MGLSQSLAKTSFTTKGNSKQLVRVCIIEACIKSRYIAISEDSSVSPQEWIPRLQDFHQTGHESSGREVS